MTNFEKWKAELTVEKAAEHIISYEDCDTCMAYSYCCRSTRYISDDVCKDTIRAWAEQEVDE